MKLLKWLFYIILAIVVAGLILALFLPSKAKVSTGKMVAASPAQVFVHTASYTDRGAWDPWLSTEPEAEWEVIPEEGYVGSTYTWSGEKIGSGKMEVDSVVFGQYIASRIWFGDQPDPALVEWTLEPVGDSTRVTWTFTADAPYPFGRLFLNLMKGSLRKDFEKGMDNLARYLAENPPSLAKTSGVKTSTIGPMTALVAREGGTMETIGEKLSELYTAIEQEVKKHELGMAGAPFVHYLTWDEETGQSDYLAGVPVTAEAEPTEPVMLKLYPEMEVISVTHFGPYEEFKKSYNKIIQYIEENQVETTGEAFEFYHTDPMAEPDVTRWKTVIAFPLK